MEENKWFDEEEFFTPFNEELIYKIGEADSLSFRKKSELSQALALYKSVEPLAHDESNFGDGGKLYQTMFFARYANALSIANFPEEALKMSQLSEKIMINDASSQYTENYLFLGNIHIKMKDFDKAITLYDKGINHYKENFEDGKEIVLLCTRKALILLHLNNNEEAKKYFFLAEKYNKTYEKLKPYAFQNDNQAENLLLYFFLKEIYLKENNVKKSELYREKYFYCLQNLTLEEILFEIENNFLLEIIADKILNDFR